MSEKHKEVICELRTINLRNISLFKVLITVKLLYCVYLLIGILGYYSFYFPSVIGKILGTDLVIIIVFGIQLFQSCRLENKLEKKN